MFEHNEKIIAANKIFLHSTQSVDPLTIVNKLFVPLFFRDRFGVLNKYSPFRISESVDEVPSAGVDMPFSDIVDAVASDITSKYQRILVLWSGGVDSTAVVVAILRNKTPNTSLKVYCTDGSVKEYPFFYQALLSQGVDVVVTDQLIDDLREAECDAILSGWCADQLFGSDVHLDDLTLYNKPWIDGLNALWKIRYPHLTLSNRSLDVLEGVYNEYAKHLGLELTQFCEFAWLFNFGCKFSHVQEKMRLCMAGSHNQGKARGFFDNILFQRWAMGNFGNLKKSNIYSDVAKYKLELKQYIYEYTNDSDYLANKGKIGSWAPNVATQMSDLSQLAVLTDNGVKIYKLTSGCNNCFYRLSDLVAISYMKEKRS